MPIHFRRPAALAFAFALSSAAALADRIYLTDGKTLDEIEIVNETLAGVAYKAKGKSGEQTVQADSVISVEYTKLPRLLDEAESDANENNLDTAAASFEEFADGVFSGENKKDKQAWAPAYALQRALQLNQSMASEAALTKVVALADKLIAQYAESRYVPGAFVAKAEAQRDLGKGPQALETVAALKQFVQSKGLSDGFRLEAELLEVQTSGAKGQAKRDKLIELGGRAGTRFPIVRNRARVLEAETYIDGASPDYAKARKIYEGVVKDPKATDGTLAGAYTGLGDCVFQEGLDKVKANVEAGPTFKEASLHYLRVVIVYKTQTRYVPKALFQAGRAFDFMGPDNKPNARKMYTAVIQQYPGTSWAKEAKNARK